MKAANKSKQKFFSDQPAASASQVCGDADFQVLADRLERIEATITTPTHVPGSGQSRQSRRRQPHTASC